MQFQIISPGGYPGHDALFTAELLNGIVRGTLPMWRSWRMPRLYESGVHWQLDPLHGTGKENLKPPPLILQRGWGDCGELTLWRLLELNDKRWYPLTERRKGGPVMIGVGWHRPPAHAVVDWVGDDMHAFVRDNGRDEDPSLRLGMR